MAAEDLYFLKCYVYPEGYVERENFNKVNEICRPLLYPAP